MYALRVDIENVAHKIGYCALVVVTLLTLVPLSTGYIDCRISCRRCHENTEHPSVLEVYCAMCEECKQRRRERAQGRTSTTRASASQMTPLVRMRDGYDESGEFTPNVQTQTAMPPGQGQQPGPPLMQQPPPALPQPPPQPNAQQQPPPNMQLVQLSQQQHQPQQQPPQQPPPQQQPPQQPPPQQQPPQQQLPPQQQPPQQQPPQQQPPQQQLLQQPLQAPMLPPMQQLQRQAYQPSYGWPTGCPSPPPCSDSEEEIDLLRRTTTTSTTTTTQSPTTPCPSFPPCRRRKKTPGPMMMQCMPCMPMCPCPAYTFPTREVMLLHATQSLAPDYHYLYVGLPKNALRSMVR